MQFDFPAFKKRFEHEQLMHGNAALLVQNEIRRAEGVKAGLSEENSHASPFVSEAINRIDTYVFQLQELARQVNPQELDLDQQTNLKDHKVRDRIADRLDRLKEQGEANASTEDPMLRRGPEEE
jgi:uncharacterized protein (DUF1786 family)